MYVLQEALFPFESFVKDMDQDDRIFMLLSSIEVEPVVEANGSPSESPRTKIHGQRPLASNDAEDKEA